MHERHARTLKAINARVLEALKNNRLSTAMEAVRAVQDLIKLVRAIFALYLALGSIMLTVDELKRRAWGNKTCGRSTPGGPTGTRRRRLR